MRVYSLFVYSHFAYSHLVYFHFVYCPILSTVPFRLLQFRLLSHFVYSHFVYFPYYVKKPHPNIFEFTELIKSEESASEVLITQLRTGGVLAKRRNAYRKVDKKLDRLKEKFQNNKNGMCDYLKAVGYLFAQWG